MVTSFFKKVGNLLKRIASTVIPGCVLDGVSTIRNDETIYDVQGDSLQEPPEMEITSFTRLPFNGAVKNGHDECCIPPGEIPGVQQDMTQGAVSTKNESLLADLCPSDTSVVSDYVNGVVGRASPLTHLVSPGSTVVAGSLHPELSAHDSDCLYVEPRCETQTLCELPEDTDDIAYPPPRSIAQHLCLQR